MSRCPKKLARQHLVQPQQTEPGETCLPCANPTPCPVCLHDLSVTIKYGKCNFYNTRKPHSCTPVYIQLHHMWNVINYQVLSVFYSLYWWCTGTSRESAFEWGGWWVFLIYESLEMLSEVPPCMYYWTAKRDLCSQCSVDAVAEVCEDAPWLKSCCCGAVIGGDNLWGRRKVSSGVFIKLFDSMTSEIWILLMYCKNLCFFESEISVELEKHHCSCAACLWLK